MERKFLESFGLEKEQIDAICDRASQDIGRKIDEYQQKIDAEIAKTEAIQEKLDTANSTINDLKKANKDNEGLQQQIEQYKANIEALEKSAQEQRINYQINTRLTEEGFIDPRTARALLDLEKITEAKDGTLTGLDEQIQAVKADERNSYLLKSTEPATPTEPPTRGGYEPLAGEEIKSSQNTMTDPVLAAVSQGRTSISEERAGASSFWDSSSF